MFITAYLINPDSVSCVSEVCTCTEGWIEDPVAANRIACIEGKESGRKREREREREGKRTREREEEKEGEEGKEGKKQRVERGGEREKEERKDREICIIIGD